MAFFLLPPLIRRLAEIQRDSVGRGAGFAICFLIISDSVPGQRGS